MSLEEAAQWPDLLDRVKRLVKPERDKNKRETRRKYWWRFGETTPALYEALRPLTRCLANSLVSKHLMFSPQETGIVFSHKCAVFPLPEPKWFAVLQSRIHEAWARLLSSTMRNDLNYSPSDCFETFPFPGERGFAALDTVGKEFDAARGAFVTRHAVGLTTTYNRLKDPAVTTPDARALRDLHEQLDRAVLKAYGWSDIAVPPYCAATPAQLEAFEDEVIDRLFALNARGAVGSIR